MPRDDILVVDPTFCGQSPLHFFLSLRQSKHGGHSARYPVARPACSQESTVCTWSWDTLQHALSPDANHIAVERRQASFH